MKEILDRLAAQGGRRTAARQLIIETLAATARHITADEIAGLVKKKFPSVNLSTVYRTLEALSESGVVEHIHFGHGPATYHLADDAHEHLFCEACEQVEEVPSAKLRRLTQMLDKEYGFEMSPGHFAFVGRCAQCRDR